MTHQQLEATDVGKSAGCLKPRGSTSSCRKPHLAGKHGKKQWEKQLGSASGHVVPRVKSRFAVGGSALRSSPKMLKTRPLPTTSVFRACGPSREMCQWNNDLLRWWCMIKPNNWYSNYIQAPFLGYKAWKRPFVIILGEIAIQQSCSHLLGASSPLHSLLPPAAQFPEPVCAYDRICRPYTPCWQGWPQPSRQTWSPSFQFPAECCSRPPETWTRATWIYAGFVLNMEIMGLHSPKNIHHDHLLPWPSYHLCWTQEQRQQQQSQQPTAIQLHGSLSHKEQHQLTKVPSLSRKAWSDPCEENQPCWYTVRYDHADTLRCMYVYIPGSSKYLKWPFGTAANASKNSVYLKVESHNLHKHPWERITNRAWFGSFWPPNSASLNRGAVFNTSVHLTHRDQGCCGQ